MDANIEVSRVNVIASMARPPKFMEQKYPKRTKRFVQLFNDLFQLPESIAKIEIDCDHTTREVTINIALTSEKFQSAINVVQDEDLTREHHTFIQDYLELWSAGICRPGLGDATYHGLLASGELSYSLDNHSADMNIAFIGDDNKPPMLCFTKGITPQRVSQPSYKTEDVTVRYNNLPHFLPIEVYKETKTIQFTLKGTATEVV